MPGVAVTPGVLDPVGALFRHVDGLVVDPGQERLGLAGPELEPGTQVALAVDGSFVKQDTNRSAIPSDRAQPCTSTWRSIRLTNQTTRSMPVARPRRRTRTPPRRLAMEGLGPSLHTHGRQPPVCGSRASRTGAPANRCTSRTNRATAGTPRPERERDGLVGLLGFRLGPFEPTNSPPEGWDRPDG